MNILLADSDRDLLQCYQKLLTMDGHSVTTAFDGAQAVSLLRKEPFDIAVLEETLPRIEHEQLLQYLEREKVPVIVLAGGVSVNTLLQPALPNAYLPFPFLPAELTGLIRAVTEKASSSETLSVCGVEVNVAGFCFSGSRTRLTNGEIDLIRALVHPLKTAGKNTRVMIHALNEKLKGLGKTTRIIYELEKGYRLVN